MLFDLEPQNGPEIGQKAVVNELAVEKENKREEHHKYERQFVWLKRVEYIRRLTTQLDSQSAIVAS